MDTSVKVGIWFTAGLVGLGLLAHELGGRPNASPTPAIEKPLAPKNEFERRSWDIADCVRTRGGGNLGSSVSDGTLGSACARWVDRGKPDRSSGGSDCHPRIPADECDALERRSEAGMRGKDSSLMGQAITTRELMQGGWRDQSHLESKGFRIVEVPGQGYAVWEKGSQRYFCGGHNYGMCRPLR